MRHIQFNFRNLDNLVDVVLFNAREVGTAADALLRAPAIVPTLRKIETTGQHDKIKFKGSSKRTEKTLSSPKWILQYRSRVLPSV